MRAEPEGDVVVVGPTDVVGVGSVEHLLVAVGRAVHQHQLVAGVELLAVQLVVLGDEPGHVQDRGHPADELLDRGPADHRRVGSQALRLVGVLDQVPERGRDDRPGRLGATVDEQQALADDHVVAHRLAVDLGVAPDRHHVVGGVGTLLRDQLGAGDGELERGEDAGVVVIAGAAAERDRLGGPALDVLPPVEAEPQVAGDHHRRQRRRQRVDCIDRPSLERAVDQFGHDGTDLVLVRRDGAGREPTGDEATLRLVHGVVLPDHRAVVVLLGRERPVGVAVGVPPRLLLDVDDVAVAADAPEPVDVVAVHRRVLPEPAVRRCRVGRIEVTVEQVDLRQRCRATGGGADRCGVVYVRHATPWNENAFCRRQTRSDRTAARRGPRARRDRYRKSPCRASG